MNILKIISPTRIKGRHVNVGDKIEMEKIEKADAKFLLDLGFAELYKEEVEVADKPIKTEVSASNIGKQKNNKNKK